MKQERKEIKHKRKNKKRKQASKKVVKQEALGMFRVQP